MILDGKFIFIVEDNPQNRLVYQIALNRHGAWLEYETSGHDVVSHLKRLHTVHIIVLDLMLPGNFSGYDVYDQIRELEQYKTVPIVAVTAADPSEAIPLTRQKGFNGLLTKPIDVYTFPQQLLQIIEGEQIW